MDNRNGIHGLSQIGLMGLNVVVGDQSGQSDSTSEISAAESVATNRSNVIVFVENENGNRNENKNNTFIDFLGVGAC